MTREARHTRCPESVLGWIPWYADGSLTDRQRGAVESHAAECADCRAELDMISGAPFEIDVELPDPDRAFAEITARIAAAEEEEGIAPGIPTPSPHDVDAADEWARIADWIEDDAPMSEREASGQLLRGPWGRSPALAAAAAVVLLLLGGLAGGWISSGSGSILSGDEVDVYEVASADVPANAATGPMIDVVFREEATAGEIAGILREVGGEIVSGPTNLGVYRLRLASPSPDGASVRESSGIDLDVVLARLKRTTDGVAVFAEVVP